MVPALDGTVPGQITFDILEIGDDMMNRTWDIESSVSMHATMTATRQINVY
jgi:hypothetical protein